jgi:hypothetical protein
MIKIITFATNLDIRGRNGYMIAIYLYWGTKFGSNDESMNEIEKLINKWVN